MILIENYKGINIYFYPEEERFASDLEDKWGNKRQSFAAAKKAIDDYKKENEVFIPFKIRPLHDLNRIITISGIRTDNRFVYKDKESLEQISEYLESDYIGLHEDDEEIIKEINDKKRQKVSLSAEMYKLRNSLKGKPLKQIKQEILKNK